jgi:Putative transposase, YhgA-like
MFKAAFGQPEHARGALRAIVPPALAEVLDWSTLVLQPGSFVDVALSSSTRTSCTRRRGATEVNDYVEPEELQGLLEREIGPEPRTPS